MNKQYSLRILPIFEEDLLDIVSYISKKLDNPQAANKFVDEVEEAILNRLRNPASFEKFVSVRKREHDYYRIRVKNFTVFYVLIDNIMEVRRILYNKRDFSKIL